MDPKLEKFIKKSNETHEFRYDYSKSTLKTTRDKVEIICRDHGSFFQRASAHTLGQGCPSCSNLSDRFENFIRKSKIIHKDKYDYSLVEYRGIYEPVIIICPKHGEFSQKPRLHISGYGCKRCGCEVKRDRKHFKKRKSLEQWIDKCNKVHGFKYDYSLITKIDSDRKQKLPIRCSNGHLFYQTIKDHSSGNGCRFCSFQCYDTETFIKLSNNRHGSKYDYSKSIYVNQDIKVIITCPKHGDFEQKPSNHYHLGNGCPRCRESQGEIEIRKWLSKNNIEFKKDKSIEGCVHINKLRFDFYLEKLNICIEFDGAHHYKPIMQFGGLVEHEKVKQRDLVKNKFCLDSGIKLIRIGYKDINRIPDILESEIIQGLKKSE